MPRIILIIQSIALILQCNTKSYCSTTQEFGCKDNKIVPNKRKDI